MARSTPISYHSLFHNFSEPRYLKQTIKLLVSVNFPSLISDHSMIAEIDAAMLSISGVIGDELLSDVQLDQEAEQLEVDLKPTLL